MGGGFKKEVDIALFQRPSKGTLHWIVLIKDALLYYTHFEVIVHIASVEEDGIVTLNGKEASIACSKTVGELTTGLQMHRWLNKTILTSKRSFFFTRIASL